MTELGFQCRPPCLQPALPFPQPPAIRHHFQITPESSALASFPQSLLLPQVSVSVVTSSEKLTLPDPSRIPFLLLNSYAFAIKDFASFLVPVSLCICSVSITTQPQVPRACGAGVCFENVLFLHTPKESTPRIAAIWQEAAPV